MMNRTLLVLLAVFATACAPLPLDPTEPGPGEMPDTAPPVEDRDDASSGPAAVLLQQGRSQLHAGQHAEAAATLERALRIEPRNPWLWLELAQAHFAAGNAQQADAHASKALSLAGDNHDVRIEADELLDDIRRP